jgi:phenylpropionate dioxygenase-like ring-hydroxylating dioxygenase large terminal subunit
VTVPYEAIPNGWFAVAQSKELRAGRVLEKAYFGREWVLWRDAAGAPVMHDAYCAHLGAHLGGGRVRGDHIHCPFHGFAYGRDGGCASTPDGRTPPRVRLRTLPLRESAGLVLGWWHAEGEPPGWNAPELDEPGFTRFKFLRRTFRGHPQEICENSSDLVHFGPTHGYGDPHALSEPHVDGHVLRVDYGMHRSLDFLGMPNRRAPLRFSAEVFGLGLSRVHARMPTIGVEADLLVMPTPITAERVELNFAARVKQPRIPLLGLLLRELFVRGYTSDLMADVPIWSRKRYVARPPLIEGEQPIAAYRKYVQQFYSEPAEPKPLELARPS